MINFEEELSKFASIDGIDDVEKSIESDELRDIMDLLNYICVNVDKR